MGGRVGRGGVSPEDLEKLEKLAKKEISKTPQKRSIYISFSGEDLNDVNLLRGQAKSENTDLDFVDRSLQQPFDSKNAEYIKRGIRERIKQCSVTVIYITDNTASSKWVDWEIRESIDLGKGIIAMYKGDSPPSTIPKAIEEFKIKLVPWNHEQLSKAIEGVAKKK